MKILPLQFLLSVIGLIDKSSLVKSEGVGVEEAKLCSDLRAFVASFLFLREVEKKALKDWDNPVTNSSLRQTLAELLSKDTAFSTSRYSGGAKERAEAAAETVARRSGWVGQCACCLMLLIRHSDLRFARRGQRCFLVCLACALLSASQCVTV